MGPIVTVDILKKKSRPYQDSKPEPSNPTHSVFIVLYLFLSTCVACVSRFLYILPELYF